MYALKFSVQGLVLLALLVSVSFAGEIHEACSAGEIEQVRKLLTSDSTLVNAVNEAGSSPLHLAVSAGQVELVGLLLDAGAEIEGTDGRGFTPLLRATFGGQTDVARLLVDRGAEVNATHKAFGVTPVVSAFTTECRSGHSPNLTRFLIERGAEFDPDAVNPMAGMPHLFIAIIFDNSEMIEYLIELGADIRIVNDRNGKTPVNEATSRGRTEAVKVLVAHGADVTTPDTEGNPPIRYAAESGLADIVSLLADNGAERDFIERQHGRTLVHLAAINGYLDVADQLVAWGCDLNATDSHGWTPVYYAARYGSKKIADLLVSHGADVPDRLEKNYGKASFLVTPPAQGEAVACYLNNRGWAVKTSDHLLVIDYEQFRQVVPEEPSLANGFVTREEIGDQDVCVFYTTYHGDPGELSHMHRLEDSLARVRYVHDADEPWRGCNNTTYLSPGEFKDFGDMQVWAIRPTSEKSMATLAYLCRVDSLWVFYAGFATDDLDRYRQVVDSLAEYTDRIDLAFLPIPEPEAADSSDFQYFLERFHPRAVCLLDPNRREEIFPSIAEKVVSWGFDTQVFGAENPGDRLVYTRHP